MQRITGRNEKLITSTFPKKRGRKEEAHNEDKKPKLDNPLALTRNSNGSAFRESDGSSLLSLLAGLLAELERLFNKIGQEAGKQELLGDQTQLKAINAYGNATEQTAEEESKGAKTAAFGSLLGAGVGLFAGALSFGVARRGINGDKELNTQQNALDEHLDVLNSEGTGGANVKLTQDEMTKKAAADKNEQEKASIEDNLKKLNFTPQKVKGAGKSFVTEDREEFLKAQPKEVKEKYIKDFEERKASLANKSQRRAQTYNNYAQLLAATSQGANAIGSSAGGLASAKHTVARGEEQAMQERAKAAEESLGNQVHNAGAAQTRAGEDIQGILKTVGELATADKT